ncbi:MAG TPA: DUF4403 family protein [Polyangiaceae bacterium]|nr:DUF4403 family protein [Polyangiaceae bacterium]
MDVASSIDLVLEVPLDALREAAEAQLAPSVDVAPFNFSINGGADASGGISLGYHVERERLSISPTTEGVRTDLSLRYWVDGRRRTFVTRVLKGPLIRFSCGTNGEPMRSARVSLLTKVDVNAAWQVTASTAVGAVQADDRCRVTALNVDLTDRLTSFLGARLQAAVGSLNERTVREFDLAARARSVWSTLADPLSVGQASWLDLRPEGVVLGSLSAGAESMRMTLRLRAKPRIVLGPKPASKPTPLPSLERGPVEDSFALTVPALVTYDEANRQLRQTLQAAEARGQLKGPGGAALHVSGASLRGERGKLVLALTLDGKVKGSLHLRGTPSYDRATSTLRFPDLEFDVQTSDPSLAALLGDPATRTELQGVLRDALRIDAVDVTRRATEAARGALNRDVGTVKLTGTLTSTELIGVQAEDSALAVSCRIRGSLKGQLR